MHGAGPSKLEIRNDARSMMQCKKLVRPDEGQGLTGGRDEAKTAQHELNSESTFT
jgi:hypothetical protein